MGKGIKGITMSESQKVQQANARRFKKYVKRICAEHDITLDLRRTKVLTLTDNVKCSGYFDEQERVLAVAMKHRDALGILVHEFCHLMQYLDYKRGKFRLWRTALNALSQLDCWLAGEPVNNIKRVIGYSRDLELDNEKRAVAMIEKWDLPIDVDDYIRKANAYILFYNWMHKTRRWSVPPNTPYNNVKIYSSMSNKFNMKYTTLSRNVRKAFELSGI